MARACLLARLVTDLDGIADVCSPSRVHLDWSSHGLVASLALTLALKIRCSGCSALVVLIDMTYARALLASCNDLACQDYLCAW